MTEHRLPHESRLWFATYLRPVAVAGYLVVAALVVALLVVPAFVSSSSFESALSESSLWLGLSLLMLLAVFEYTFVVRLGEPAESIDISSHGFELRYPTGKRRATSWATLTTPVRLRDVDEAPGLRVIQISSAGQSLTRITPEVFHELVESASAAGLAVTSRQVNEVFRNVRYVRIDRPSSHGR